MTKLLKSLIISTTLAVLACSAPVRRASTEQDPCAVLGGLNMTATTVQQASDCYKSIEFNPGQANTTLNSMYTLYNDFFVFRDTALTPYLELPFTSDPVDILAELDNIRQNDYTTDFDFHSDLTILAKSLNDAHVTYAPECYNSIVFQQPLSLYAPVVNGHQSIRVFKDDTTNNVTDCEVVEIDGQEARSYLQTWADKYTGLSKDAGVRLNNVLVSQNYSPDTQTWSSSSGAFAQRSSLPEAEYLDYVVRCDPPKSDNVNIRAPWSVVKSPDPGTFTDKASFLEKVCLSAPAPVEGQNSTSVQLSPRSTPPMIENKVLTEYRREVHLQEYAKKQKGLISRRADGEPAPSPQDLPDATFVAGNITAAYQLKSDPNIGVLVVPTMMVTTAMEVPTIQSYLAMLGERNVTHIIIDTSGNTGGDVAFASLLVNVLFPSMDKTTSSHLARFRDTPAATALAGANLVDTNQSTYFSVTELANKTTGLPFTTNLFLDPVELTINDRKAEYTEEFYMNYDIDSLNQTAVHPWTGNASKIVILTDGQCGSACGMFSDLLVSKHGVKAVAVGGHAQKELSMFSYAGASILSLDGIMDSFEKLSVPPTLTRLPYKNLVNIGMIEVYSGNDTIPLEYNPMRYVAAHRLDYTSETARNQDQLWAAVAKTAWA